MHVFSVGHRWQRDTNGSRRKPVVGAALRNVSEALQ
jgi:hypothetical protein